VLHSQDENNSPNKELCLLNPPLTTPQITGRRDCGLHIVHCRRLPAFRRNVLPSSTAAVLNLLSGDVLCAIRVHTCMTLYHSI
jgi:hypothetical protein